LTALSSGQLSELIAAIYDRVIDPGDWGETLRRIRVMLGAEISGLSLIDLRANAFKLNFLENVPDKWARGPRSLGGRIIEAWGGESVFNALPLEEPAIFSRVAPRPPTGRSSETDEVTAAGFADGMSLILARDDAVMSACAFYRAKRAGPFREDEIALARLLLPHMQRAIGLSRMLELATLRATAFEAALDAVALPTMLVTRQFELVHANSAAQGELRREDVLRVSAGRLAAADVRDHGRLKAALATASNRPDAAPGKLDVALGPHSRRLKLLPLPRGSVRGSLAPTAAAAIILAKPDGADRADPEVIGARLIERHGLTRAEAAVALEVAKGDGRSAAAARLRIRENTVRTHLSSIFLKLGVNRQAQLVKMVDDAS